MKFWHRLLLSHIKKSKKYILVIYIFYLTSRIAVMAVAAANVAPASSPDASMHMNTQQSAHTMGVASYTALAQQFISSDKKSSAPHANGSSSIGSAMNAARHFGRSFWQQHSATTDIVTMNALASEYCHSHASHASFGRSMVLLYVQCISPTSKIAAP
jgi:hypothetical protein